MGFFDKLKKGLGKTKKEGLGPLTEMFRSFRRIDEDFIDELEEKLIEADVGVETTEEIIENLRNKIKSEKPKDSEESMALLRSILREMVGDGDILHLDTKPSVILVIGVNGVGKTTSIAKIANNLITEGKKVLLAAGDTFRAAAGEQLNIWADRIGADIVRHEEGGDPAAVVFDAINAAKARSADVLIIDTAGRLHNKKNLMNELEKIDRVVSRELPGCSRETLLVLDATTGHNAVNQAKEFKNAADLTGLVITKLDGTAKGGIVLSIKSELGIPVKFIGVGEAVDDMQYFNADDFVAALTE